MNSEMNTPSQGSVLILSFPYSSVYGGGEQHTLSLIDSLPHHFVAATTSPVLLTAFSERNVPIQRVSWMPKEPVTGWAALIFFFTAPFAWVILLITVMRVQRRSSLRTLYCLSLTEKLLITPVARLLGLRVVWMEHAPIGRWLFLNPWRVIYVVWSFFARVITVSDAVALQLRRLGVPQKSLRVIANGVPEDFFALPQTPYRQGDPFIVSSISRLSPEKGVADFLHACALLIQRLPTLQVRIVGAGDERASLEELVKATKIEQHITFVGFVEDVQAEIARAHVVVVPSHREAFGMTAAQALAARTPVVATRVGGLPTVVAEEEWLVDVASPQQIADAISGIERHYDAACVRTQVHAQRIHSDYSFQRMIEAFAEEL